jgi:nuclear pore complex protein Nup155
MAQGRAPGSPALTPQNFQIIGLCVVNQSESRTGVQLLAITTNGVRLYFSPSAISYNFTYGGFGGGHGEPRSLQLIHVRLPPPNLPHPDELLTMYRPTAPVYGSNQAAPQPAPRPYIISTLENCCYSDGLTIAAQQGDSEGTDFILCVSPDLTRIGSLNQLHAPMQPLTGQPNNYTNASFGAPGPTRPPLTEYASILSIPGRTWAMAPVPSTKPPAVSSPSPVVTNELATQFNEPPRQFMILTNVGLTFLAKRRAVDYLKAVIEEVQSEGNVQPIIEFRDR